MSSDRGRRYERALRKKMLNIIRNKTKLKNKLKKRRIRRKIGDNWKGTFNNFMEDILSNARQPEVRLFFPFQMSWRYQIWTAKCRYSQSDDWPEILGKTTAQECKKSTSGCARKTSMLKFVLVSSNLTLSKKLRVWSYLNESVQKCTVDMVCV